jgi:transposase
VLAVISEGFSVTEVAARFGVSRQTLHAWLAKYELDGLERLGDGSHRPRSCPHQMPADVEVVVANLRRSHPSWGPKRLVFELARRGVDDHSRFCMSAYLVPRESPPQVCEGLALALALAMSRWGVLGEF